MTDLLIRHVTAITLDSRRRVLDAAVVAVEGRRIVAVRVIAGTVPADAVRHG